MYYLWCTAPLHGGLKKSFTKNDISLIPRLTPRKVSRMKPPVWTALFKGGLLQAMVLTGTRYVKFTLMKFGFATEILVMISGSNSIGQAISHYAGAICNKGTLLCIKSYTGARFLEKLASIEQWNNAWWIWHNCMRMKLSTGLLSPDSKPQGVHWQVHSRENAGSCGWQAQVQQTKHLQVLYVPTFILSGTLWCSCDTLRQLHYVHSY